MQEKKTREPVQAIRSSNDSQLKAVLDQSNEITQSSKKEFTQPITTLESGRPESNMFSDRQGAMMYTELEAQSNHQRMQALEDDLEEHFQQSNAPGTTHRVDSQASSKFINPLKSTDKNLDDDWEGFLHQKRTDPSHD